MANSLPGVAFRGPSPKTLTLATLAAVANALVTSLATAASPVVLSGASLNGASANPGPAVFPTPSARQVSVSTASNAGSYAIGAGNAITVKGTDLSGNALTDTLVLTAVNGGETIKSAQLFATVTEIDIPAQNDTGGHFTFGVGDTGVPYTREVTVGTAGTLHVFYGGDGSSDTIASAVVTARATQPINVSRFFADSTATNVTLYF